MPKQYETRTVSHGVEWGAYAPFTVSEQGEITFDTPKIFTGLTDVEFKETQDSEDKYADNVIHVQLFGQVSTEGTLKCYQFPTDFVQNHMGKKLLANGGLKDTPNKKSFAFMFQTTITDEFGENKNQLYIYYNVKAGATSIVAQTDEDKLNPNEFELPLIVSQNNFVLDDDGEPTTYMMIDESDDTAGLFAMAYEQVILPTTVGTP